MDEPPDVLKPVEEQLLASRTRRLSPELRERVLGQVHDALAVELRASRWQSHWAFVTAVAASVLVWMNVSLSATTATDCRVPLAPSTAEVDRLAREIHQLLSELSVVDARHQSILAWSGNTVVLQPELPVPSTMPGPHNALNQLHQ
jgi:hypothetical protein